MSNNSSLTKKEARFLYRLLWWLTGNRSDIFGTDPLMDIVVSEEMETLINKLRDMYE